MQVGWCFYIFVSGLYLNNFWQNLLCEPESLIISHFKAKFCLGVCLCVRFPYWILSSSIRLSKIQLVQRKWEKNLKQLLCVFSPQIPCGQTAVKLTSALTMTFRRPRGLTFLVYHPMSHYLQPHSDQVYSSLPHSLHDPLETGLLLTTCENTSFTSSAWNELKARRHCEWKDFTHKQVPDWCLDTTALLFWM